MLCCVFLGMFRTFCIFFRGTLVIFSLSMNWQSNIGMEYHANQFYAKFKSAFKFLVSKTHSSNIRYYWGSMCKRSWGGIEPYISYKWWISVISIVETSPCADLCLNGSMRDKGPHKVSGYHVVVNQLCSFGSHSKHLCHIVDSSATCSWQGGLAHSLWSALDLLQSCPVLTMKWIVIIFVLMSLE